MEIRPATSKDVELILSFLRQKAGFDRDIGIYSGQPPVTEEQIRKNFFGEVPIAHGLFAELSGKPVGFALYGFRFASYEGRPYLWLEDLYVDPKVRKQGVAMALMNRLAQVAAQRDCSHLAWHADARNKAGIGFYRRLGAGIAHEYGNNLIYKWLVPESLRTEP